MLFRDRADAGQKLGHKLATLPRDPQSVVLALPKGGVPVAYEVARALEAPLDVLIVRKLGAPGQEELAMGALASGGVRVVNDDLVRQLGVSAAALEDAVRRAQREIDQQEAAFRGAAPRSELADRRVILVDDGLATGATMLAGVRAVGAARPRRVVVAVPVASRQAFRDLAREADEVVCLEIPEPFSAVGQWYDNFGQTSESEVRELLQAARGAQPTRA